MTQRAISDDDQDLERKDNATAAEENVEEVLDQDDVGEDAEENEA